MQGLFAALASWPLPVSFFAFLALMVVLVMFRAEIGERLRSLRKIGPTRFDAGPRPEQQAERAAEREAGNLGVPAPAERAQQPALPGLEPARAAADDLIDGLRGPHFVAIQQGILGDLERRGVAASPVEMNRVLLRFTTMGVVLADFERLYDAIFGSQIDLLRELARRPMPVGEVTRSFDAAKATWPDFYKTFTAEQHVGFLGTSGLATAANDVVTITDKGRAFLMFLIARRKGPRYF